MIPAQAHTSRAAKHRLAGSKAVKGGQWNSAAREFERAVQFAPEDAEAWRQLAYSRFRLTQLDEAASAARRAFDLQPANPKACLLLAELLVKQNRYAEAVDAFSDLDPQVPRDHAFQFEHASALYNAGRYAQALPVFVKALSLNMTNPDAHFGLGMVFKELQREADASLCFQTALAVDRRNQTSRAHILSQLVYVSLIACDWRELDQRVAELLAATESADESRGTTTLPFVFMAIAASRQQILRAGRLLTRSLVKDVQPLPAPGPRRPGRIRVGYLSADFSDHATALLVTELLELRDRSRFEVFLYSHSREDGTEIQQRVRAAGDHYLEVNALSDDAIAQQMRHDGLDIAIDLKGHTRDSRFQVLARRPAPVQVSYLGFPGSCGADFLDYVIGDRIVTPLEHAPDYTEKIAQMPCSYQPNDRQRPLPEKPLRADIGLPEDAVVLCCFNQTFKMSPAVLDLWARILIGAPNTVLWMLQWADAAHRNLAKELAARGVDLDRVLFAPRLSLHDHLARLRCADLFLDTWPYNAHTTASEALWAGVPVLTVPGPTFSSRVAASLVTACGMAGMACADAEAYVQAAIRLATHPEELRAAQAHLQVHRLALPLFDTERTTRDYEALLTRMFERSQAGLAPDHLPCAEVPLPAEATVAGLRVAAAQPPTEALLETAERAETAETETAPAALQADTDDPAALPVAVRLAALDAFVDKTHAAVRGLVDAVVDLRERPQAGPHTPAWQALEQRLAALESAQVADRYCRDLAQASRMVAKERTVVFLGTGFFGCNLKYAWLAFRSAARQAGVSAWFLPMDARQAALVAELGDDCFPAHHADWTEDHLQTALSAAVLVASNHVHTPDPRAAALLAGARQVQLWHGVSIKEIGLRNLAPLKLEWPNAARVLAACGPYARMIGTAAGAESEWRRWFAFDAYAAIGYPRNDVFFREATAGDLLNVDTPLLEEARAAQAAGKRVVLYAPTWRDMNRGVWILEAGLERIARELAQQGDLLIVNLHPAEHEFLPHLKRAIPHLRLVAPETDIYPLLKHTSLLITDYSSVMFDYLLLDKPIVLFRPDHAHYVAHSRRLFEDKLAERPGPLAENARDLLALLRPKKGGDDAVDRPADAQARGRLRDRLFDQPDGRSGDRLNAVLLQEVDLALATQAPRH